MRPLTTRYRRRLAAVWSIQAAVIVWNLIRPSFAAMAVPMLALWLYTIACMAQEVSAFRRSFSVRYPGRFREWTGSSAAGPRPVRCRRSRSCRSAGASSKARSALPSGSLPDSCCCSPRF